LIFRIDMEDSDSGSTDCGFTNQIHSLPLEVVLPIIASRMKEFRHLPCLRIYASKVAAFVKIAINTGQRQIIQIVPSTMHPWEDVLDV